MRIFAGDLAMVDNNGEGMSPLLAGIENLASPVENAAGGE